VSKGLFCSSVHSQGSFKSFYRAASSIYRVSFESVDRALLNVYWGSFECLKGLF